MEPHFIIIVSLVFSIEFSKFKFCLRVVKGAWKKQGMIKRREKKGILWNGGMMRIYEFMTRSISKKFNEENVVKVN